MKKAVCIAFVLEFCALMLFYGYAYPIIPFWGDDFQLISEYPKLPVSGGWIPARLLPLYIQTNIATFAAYMIMPITHLDFLDSIALMCAIVLSSAFVGFHWLFYTLSHIMLAKRSQALLISSVFIVGCAIIAKVKMMPLLLPADLNAQGMGYLLTMVCFYTLPYLVNLGFVLGLIILILKNSNLDSTNKYILNGGGAILVCSYLAIFSMESASVLSASFAGCMLLYRIIANLKETKSFIAVLKRFNAYDYFLILVIVLWAIALSYMLHSGRANYCADFDLKRGLDYMITTIKSLRKGFIVIFVLIFIGSLLGIIFGKNNPYRFLLITLDMWFLCLVIFYTLTVSKCGATWYLMSGLLMAMLVILVVHISIFIAIYKSGYFIFSLVFFISILQSLQPYNERPRNSYMYFKSYSQSWIDQVQKAQKEGKKEIDIFVPEEFGHYHWNDWFAPSFPRSLKIYGLITEDIKVTFKPKSKAPLN